jgi:hypothetical protein
MLVFRNGNTYPKKLLEEYSFDEIKYIISQCDNITNILDILELSNSYRNKIKEFIEKHNISTSHFKSRRIVLNKYRSHQSIKYHFMKENEHKCAVCNLGNIWNNKPLTLQLDHINGNHFDNSKDNLRLLCPNCHTQTETFASRNSKNKKNMFKHCITCKININKNNISNMCKKCYIKSTNKEIQNEELSHSVQSTKQCTKCQTNIKRKSKSGFCQTCVKTESRIVKRPPYKTLVEEIDKLGYLQTGKKYEVSDNTIRKWIKTYKKLSTV